MQIGTKYRILRTDDSVTEGEYIQTKGDDANYPTFLLADGSRLGTQKDRVLGEVLDDAPPGGIERPKILMPNEDGYKADALSIDDEVDDYRFSGLEGEG